MNEIEICEREMDYCWVTARDSNGELILSHGKETLMKAPKYHASVKNVRGIWATGKTKDEALGMLIKSNPTLFNVKVIDLDMKLFR